MTINLPIGLKLLRRLPIPKKLGFLERLYGKTLSTHGISWVITSNGVTWKLDLSVPNDRWIIYGDYEGSTQMNWIRRWLRNGGMVIDSGANIGQMSLYLGPMPLVKIAAFEPLPEAVDWLEECLAKYPKWNISVYRCGLSDCKGKIPIQIDGARSTARLDWYKGKNFPILDIDVITLDEFTVENGIDIIRLWILDVEGHEFFALKGAKKLLEKKKIDAILVEISSTDTMRFLHKTGYSVNKIDKKDMLRHVSTTEVKGNCIAIPN